MYATPAPLREKVPTIPLDVEHIVLAALAKDPRLRFASIQAFAIALEQASQAAPAQLSTELPNPLFQPLASSTHTSSQLNAPTEAPTPSAQVPTLQSSRNVTNTQPSREAPAQTDRSELLTPASEVNRTPLPPLPTPQPATPAPSVHLPHRRGFSWYKPA